MKILMIILISLYTVLGHCRLFVDVSIIYKRGLDKNLILRSELHSSEAVEPGEEVEMILKNGLKFTFIVEFINFYEKIYGPSHYMNIDTRVIDAENVILSDYGSQILTTSFDESKVMIFRSEDGQQLEVTLVPRIK